jgi:hypothetical protein
VTDYALKDPAQPAQRVKLDANAILKQAWALYKRLFMRSVLMGAVVFGTLHLVQALAAKSQHPASLGLLSIDFGISGVAHVQGGLVELVRDLHDDGDATVSMVEILRRASGRLGKLVCVSVLVGLGVGLGSILFIVPGIILSVRWAVAVPVAMLEEGSARAALRRSRALLDGNGSEVFKILFGCVLLEGVVLLPLTLLTLHSGAFAQWISGTVAAALTAPLLAHALTIVYYTLREPQRPVVLDRGQRWDSVWKAHDAQRAEVAPDTAGESIDDEYQRRFDERENQWGG